MEVDLNTEYVAALDLGTNTFNLAIAKSSLPYKIVFRTEKGVFLGKGGLADKIILEDARLRAQNVLKSYSNILSDYPLKEVRCVATEAIRNAKNADEVLEVLEIDIPFSVETIEGDREAELVYKGVKSTGLLGDKNILIVDIGGGSVEFIISNRENIYWKKSYKIGISRVLELHPLSNPPKEKELVLHHNYFHSNLNELQHYINEFNVKNLIGTAGSFDAWRKMLDGTKDASPSHLMNEKDLLTQINKINTLTTNDRLKVRGLEEMRVETIVPAGILVAYLLGNSRFDSIHQCSYSLSEGVLWEMINK